MANVEVYTKVTCPYCHRAKALLDQKGATYQEIDIGEQPEKRAEMIERSGRHTVPQIFINGQLIGGCDDLYALEQAHKLDALLHISC